MIIARGRILICANKGPRIAAWDGGRRRLSSTQQAQPLLPRLDGDAVVTHLSSSDNRV